MAKFVEVHYNGEALLANLDMVESVTCCCDGVRFQVRGSYQMIDESYEEVKQIIGSAQGGIPMEPGRMYDGA